MLVYHLYSSNECICIVLQHNTKLKDLARCTVFIFGSDTHQYFLLDQTSHRETSKHSLSEIQSSNLTSIVIDGTAVNVTQSYINMTRNVHFSFVLNHNIFQCRPV